MHSPKVSLVIPVRNEADSIEDLLASIGRQTFAPDEIVIVDGGSIDDTLSILERKAVEDKRLKVIAAGPATPGKGRNIGIASARNEWVALTDAGIRLDENWLAELVAKSANTDFVYGNYSPVLRQSNADGKDSVFLTAAAVAYVAPLAPNSTRGRSIASCLLRKKVWEMAGGFPDLRAAEDLIFMEQCDKLNFASTNAPGAIVYWSLRPDISSTFAKFRLYSKHNVRAGRQWDWHYGIARQYAVLLPFVVLAFIHSFWWIFTLPAWLAARTAKRAVAFRRELGSRVLLDPRIVSMTAFLILVIDTATFIGWFEAAANPEKGGNG